MTRRARAMRSAARTSASSRTVDCPRAAGRRVLGSFPSRQKINLQDLLADLALQFRNARLGPALLAVPRKYVACPLANLTPPAQRNPLLQPLDRGQLELQVNILHDNSMTQFSFEWILSLNWLCHKWGNSILK